MNEPTTAAPLRESACHEAGHVVLCLTLDGPQLEYARAATSGRGTSRLLNAKDVEPRTAAQVSVAGRVSEQVLLDFAERPLPENDQFLLSWALSELGGTVTESDIRAEVEPMLRGRYAALSSVADELEGHPDVDVSREVLAAAFERAGGAIDA